MRRSKVSIPPVLPFLVAGQRCGNQPATDDFGTARLRELSADRQDTEVAVGDAVVVTLEATS